MTSFNVDTSLVDQWPQIVMVNDLRGQDCHRDVHVCVVFGWHWGTQVAVFEVAHHASGFRCENNTVEQELGGG